MKSEKVNGIQGISLNSNNLILRLEKVKYGISNRSIFLVRSILLIKAVVIHFWKLFEKRSQNFIGSNFFLDTGVFYRPE